MNRKDVTNQKELALFILCELNKKNRLVDFSDLFWEIGPGGGLESFQNLLDEMTEKKWLKKTVEDTGSVLHDATDRQGGKADEKEEGHLVKDR